MGDEASPLPFLGPSGLGWGALHPGKCWSLSLGHVLSPPHQPPLLIRPGPLWSPQECPRSLQPAGQPRIDLLTGNLNSRINRVALMLQWAEQ